MLLPLLLGRHWLPLMAGYAFTSLAPVPMHRPAGRDSASLPVLHPGDPLLRPTRTQSSGVRWIYTESNPGLRMAEHRIAAETDTAFAAIDPAGGMKLVVQYLKPYDAVDTLTVDPRTLAPIEETSMSAALDFEYRFGGQTVQGSVRRGTAKRRAIAATYGDAPFAFSELSMIVGALRSRVGLTVIVPLFSESDGDLEYDTLSVLKHRVAPGAPAQWVLRFGDPNIVQQYIVDESSREIVSVATLQRKTGNRIHQQRDPEGAAMGAFVPPRLQQPARPAVASGAVRPERAQNDLSA